MNAKKRESATSARATSPSPQKAEDQRLAAELLNGVRPWLCDDVEVDIRYFGAQANGKTGDLVHAVIHIGWKVPAEKSHFEIRVGGYRMGQYQRKRVKQKAVEQMLVELAAGRCSVFGETLQLPGGVRPAIGVDLNDRMRWENAINVQLSTTAQLNINKTVAGQIDDGIRTADTPFDGAQDLFTWLGLPEPGANMPPCGLTIYFLPPIDFSTDTPALSGRHLKVDIRASPNIDIAKVTLGLRMVPATGLKGRRQVASQIVWDAPAKGVRTGKLEIDTADAEQALVMLSFGGYTCRRHWFTDPSRARNVRLLAATLYDPDLSQLKVCLHPKGKHNGSTAPNFEKGVAMLAHILGFNAALNLEGQAPDITVSTAFGAMIVVECTVETHDVQAKAAKLHSRRLDLEQAMRINNHTPTVLAVLVCATARTALDLTTAGLEAKRVVLITKEDIDTVLHQLRFPPQTDVIWHSLASRLAQTPKSP